MPRARSMRGPVRHVRRKRQVKLDDEPNESCAWCGTVLGDLRWCRVCGVSVRQPICRAPSPRQIEMRTRAVLEARFGRGAEEDEP
jgi:hypothetical protein